MTLKAKDNKAFAADKAAETPKEPEHKPLAAPMLSKGASKIKRIDH